MYLPRDTRGDLLRQQSRKRYLFLYLLKSAHDGLICFCGSDIPILFIEMNFPEVDDEKKKMERLYTNLK